MATIAAGAPELYLLPRGWHRIGPVDAAKVLRALHELRALLPNTPDPGRVVGPFPAGAITSFTPDHYFGNAFEALAKADRHLVDLSNGFTRPPNGDVVEYFRAAMGNAFDAGQRINADISELQTDVEKTADKKELDNKAGYILNRVISEVEDLTGQFEKAAKKVDDATNAMDLQRIASVRDSLRRLSPIFRDLDYVPIVPAPRGSGKFYYDANTQTVYADPDLKDLAYAMAHEVGHYWSRITPSADPATCFSQRTYNEGAAEVVAGLIRKQFTENGGSPTLFPAQAPQITNAINGYYPDGSDTVPDTFDGRFINAAMVAAIKYRTYHPSTDPDHTYIQTYGKACKFETDGVASYNLPLPLPHHRPPG